jgi:hypothetical protein
MDLQNVKRLTDEISKCISLRVDRDNGDEVSGMLQELVLIQDMAAEAMSLSSMILAEKVAELYEDQKYSKLSATDKRAVVNGRASKELYFVTLSERLSRSISHGIDAYRSILSDLKSQRQNYSGM